MLPPGFEHANFCMGGKRSTIKSYDFEPLKDMKDGYFPINLNAFTDFWKRFPLMQNFSINTENYNRLKWNNQPINGTAISKRIKNDYNFQYCYNAVWKIWLLVYFFQSALNLWPSQRTFWKEKLQSVLITELSTHLNKIQKKTPICLACSIFVV